MLAKDRPFALAQERARALKSLDAEVRLFESYAADKRAGSPCAGSTPARTWDKFANQARKKLAALQAKV